MKMVFMTVSRVISAALVIYVLLATAACGPTNADPAGSDQQSQLDIVVASYPFQFIAERVAGPYGAVQNLTEPGAEPHDVELSPRQVADIAGADLVIYEDSFQPAVDAAVDQQGGDHVLDTTTVVPLQPLDEGSDHNGTEEDGHGHEALDPHVWLDPTNVVSIAAVVAARLGEADPAHRADFDANLATLKADLSDLDHDFRQGLQSCVRREFITSHAAFGYLTGRYGLAMVPIAGLSPDADPSPQHLAELHSLISEHGITTVFAETLGTKAYADTLASDLGVEAAVLDPIEGLADEESGEDYLSLMRSNLAALRVANGCR